MRISDTRQALDRIAQLAREFATTYPQRDRDNQYPREEMERPKARATAAPEEMSRLRAEASVAVSQAKIVATETGLRVCQEVFTACGARAALREQNLDRFWRDLRTLTLHDPMSFRIRSVGEYLLQDRAPAPALRY